jgi:hypothetical protein
METKIIFNINTIVRWALIINKINRILIASLKSIKYNKINKMETLILSLLLYYNRILILK